MTHASGSGGADMTQDVREAWDDLLTAAAEAGYAVTELVRPPATAAQVAAAEEAIGRRLPPDLAMLYQLSDGQVDWYGLVTGPAGNPERERGHWVGSLFGEGWTFRTLAQLENDYRLWSDVRQQSTPSELEDFDAAIDVRGGDPVRPLYTSAEWIPFATDGGGNSLAADLAPEPSGAVGQVIVIGSDEDLRRVLAPSVRALLRLCADRLRKPLAAPYVSGGAALYSLETPAAE